MMRATVALPVVLMLGAAAAAAQERCVAGHYRLPEPIAEEMRPYLICGLLRERDGHFTTRLNGTDVSIRGGGADSCDRLRQSAMDASHSRLAATMRDEDERRSFISAEFERMDQFLRIAARSYDLGVGEEPAAPPCRISHAED
jgi:hypothetical protein